LILQEVREMQILHEKLLTDFRRLMNSTLGEVFENILNQDPLENLSVYQPFITSGPRNWGKYADINNTGPLFLRVGDVGYANLDLDETYRLQLPENIGEDRARVRANDVLVTITGTIGRCCVVPSGLEDAYINQHVALIRLKEKSIMPRYLMWFVLSPFGSGQTAGVAYGQAKPGLNLTQLQNLRVPKVNITQQQRIANHLDQVYEEIQAMIALQAKDGERLKKLEQAFLEQAFRGEL
jgi:type I restriction enzyme, S subunit